MLLNKIEPFFDPQNTCVENLYVSLCNAFGRNYKNMYAYSWNFGYIKSSDLNDMPLFGDRIKRSREKTILSTDQKNAFKKYCGINPIWHTECEFQRLMDIVVKEIENNRPVMVGADIFYCSWHPFSGRVHLHSPHFCLVIGMNENGFICIDETLGNKNANLRIPGNPKTITLEYDALKKSCYGFATFEISPTVSEYPSDEMVYSSALKTLDGFEGVSDFHAMRELHADMDKYLDINKEIEGFKDLWAIDLIRCFNYIIWNRNNYCLFLNDKQIYKGVDIKPITSKMMNSINLWSNIRNYIMRYADNPNSKFDKNGVCDSFGEIITIEEGLAHEIVNAY